MHWWCQVASCSICRTNDALKWKSPTNHWIPIHSKPICLQKFIWLTTLMMLDFLDRFLFRWTVRRFSVCSSLRWIIRTLHRVVNSCVCFGSLQYPLPFRIAAFLYFFSFVTTAIVLVFFVPHIKLVYRAFLLLFIIFIWSALCPCSLDPPLTTKYIFLCHFDIGAIIGDCCLQQQKQSKQFAFTSLFFRNPSLDVIHKLCYHPFWTSSFVFEHCLYRQIPRC